MKHTIATWDLGATKCLAGLIEYDDTTQQFHLLRQACLKLTETNSLSDLIEQLESRLEARFSDTDAICIGAAGHYDGTTIQHTNPYPYAMTIADYAHLKRWPRFSVIHDYASIVCATFTYPAHPQHFHSIHSGLLDIHARRVAFGLGTGLGLKDGILFESGDFWLGHNEIGHIGITHPPRVNATLHKRHLAICDFLYRNQETLTFERLLSGPGIVNLFRFFYPQEGKNITPELVGKYMSDGKAEEMKSALSWYLGLFVGAVQLTFMPQGGIWITGGVLHNHLDILEHDEFNAGIEAFPSYLDTRKQYPLMVLNNHELALMGAAFYAARKLCVYGNSVVPCNF